MGRKRGELPTLAEATEKLGANGYVVIDVKYGYCKNKTRKNGKLKYTYIKVMNIDTGEKSDWMLMGNAKKKFKTEKSGRIKTSKHTDETVAKQVQELTNGNAELVSWKRSEKYGGHIEVEIRYNCGCIKHTYLLNNVTPPECPICSAKWKTEDAVCKITEHYAETLYDKYMTIIAHRQHTVHMIVNGKEVTRRYDVAIEIVNKYDNSFNRWIFVEYNGEQHYRPVNFGNLDEDELMRQFKGNVERDKQKVAYCEEHNIPLIVIPYWKKDRIEEILKDKLVDAIFKEASESVTEYIDKYFFS